MKKALIKNFWMEVRKSKARFFSIFFIVALGVAFFSGIQAASPDMRFSGDDYYDARKLMDLKVIGSLGLTKEDEEALLEIDGVEAAEGGWFTDVLHSAGDNVKVVHIESLSQSFNLPFASEGRLPERSGECFLDSALASANDIKVGDRFVVQEDGEQNLLLTTDFEVVGIGDSPLYISFNRGNTTLGSGEISGFAYLLPEDFDQEVFTQIYVRVHGADQLTSYTDAYEILVDRIKNAVEGIEAERCAYRLASIKEEAEEKLRDGMTEFYDGKKEAEEELAEARRKLADGEKDYFDGRKKYLDGVRQLKDGKEQLAYGKEQLADGKKELEEKKAELLSGKEKLQSGYDTLNDSQQQLNEGWAGIRQAEQKLADGEAQLLDGKAQAAEGRAQLEAGKAQLAEKERELESKKQELEAGKAQISDGKQQIEAGKAELQKQKQKLEEGRKQLEQGLLEIASAEQQLNSGRTELDAAKSAWEAQKGQLDAAFDAGMVSEEEYEAQSAVLAAAGEELKGKEFALQSAMDELAQQRTWLEGQLAQAEAGALEIEKQQNLLIEKEQELPLLEQQLAEGEKQLAAGAEALAAAKEELNRSETELLTSEKILAQSEAELLAGKQELAANKEKLLAAQNKIDAGRAELEAAEAEIADGEQKLLDGEQTIQDNEQKLLDSEKTIRENEETLADAKKELFEGWRSLKEGRQSYKEGKAEAEQKLNEAEEELLEGKRKIQELELPEWFISTRNDLPEYSDYGDNAERIRSLGKVFPVIFFLVAALISLTTMTRMVEDQRTEIGTMKALGYGKAQIAFKYICYALSAAFGGSILGVLVGEKIIPWVIIKGYGIMYHNVSEQMVISYEWKYALLASGAAIFCTVGAALFSCYRELAETPASLMRPPAPKKGKRIFLEYMPFLWNHMNFTWKSSMRNLFRYKKRFFMTIFGIAGSMGLMLVGFGLHDSIMDVALIQYAELQHYDGTIIHDEDATQKEEAELQKLLESNTEIERYTNVMLSKMSATNGHNNVSVYVYVPENLEKFREDITLKDRITKERYELTEEGAVICEKTANLLGMSVGDNLTVLLDNKKYQIPVAVVTENYMGHYVYMTPALSEKVFGKAPEYSSTVFTVKEEYKDKTEEIGQGIMACKAVLSISYTASLAGQINRMLTTLNMVVVVLIVSAGMLAFVVLYNLNNINITERQRELATLKVLGFYDGEISSYVFRENIILTILGIAAGAAFGIFLHGYTITTVEVDAVMFGRNIQPISFAYCAVLTALFSLLVNLFMRGKLKKIDMVESLKSVE